MRPIRGHSVAVIVRRMLRVMTGKWGFDPGPSRRNASFPPEAFPLIPGPSAA